MGDKIVIDSLIDPISYIPIKNPICLLPCNHIFDCDSVIHFANDLCPICRNKIIETEHSETFKRIIDLIEKMNNCTFGSQKQINLSYDLGRCILCPLIRHNVMYENPVKLHPCGHIIERFIAEQCDKCPCMFCNMVITKFDKIYIFEDVINEVKQIINKVRLQNRMNSKIELGHFDSDENIDELIHQLVEHKINVVKICVEDSSFVSNISLIKFFKQFSKTISSVSITFIPKKITNDIFPHLFKLLPNLKSLNLIGNRNIDDQIITLISDSCIGLKILNVQGCNITNICIPFLKQINLTQLAIPLSRFTKDEIYDLQIAIPHTNVM
jgi:hypothetical protein